MAAVSLKGRAVIFALCVGAAAFVVALLARRGQAADPVGALCIAIVCATMSWASAARAHAFLADAVDSATRRLRHAANGDFETPAPVDVRANLPALADTMDLLFVETRVTFDSVHNLAMFDPVTALANRTNFRRDAERLIDELHGGNCSALLFVDLDNFKSVNDTLGHAQGDQLLANVANRLRAVVHAEGLAGRRAGLIGRLAGDEFTMFLPSIGEADAARIAGRALRALGEEFTLSGHAIRVGASIGVAMHPAHGGSLTTLMKAADVAMYHAKACGRGQVQFYTEALGDALREKLELEGDLREALLRSQFRLVFQPQIDLTSGRPMSAEALLRWHHPRLGVRMPGAFLDTAEESSLIVAIGDWVIDAVATTLARWEHLGVSQRLAINISPRQIEQRHFFERLRGALEAHDATPRLLELELTEGLAMSCGDAVFDELAAFKRDGAMIAIDDFGTSASNIARLRDMPIDRIKLDRSMIADIAVCAQARSIAQSVIGLIHGLGHQVVAEGVETDAQTDVLRVLGCDAIQGYIVAQPMDEAAFLDWSMAARLVRSA